MIPAAVATETFPMNPLVVFVVALWMVAAIYQMNFVISLASLANYLFDDTPSSYYTKVTSPMNYPAVVDL